MSDFRQYYEMSNNTSLSNIWTYAPSFYAKDKLVQYRCSKCGAIDKYPLGEFAIDLEDGSKYPDILLCGASPLHIVSERVLNGWESAGITGFRSFPVEIRNIKSKRLEKVSRVNYFSIEIDDTCELDLDSMGVELVEKCDECGKYILSKPSWKIEKLEIVQKTAEGKDIFKNPIFSAMAFVSEKIVEIACKNKHSNFDFVKAEDSLNVYSKSIDYLKFCE